MAVFTSNLPTMCSMHLPIFGLLNQKFFQRLGIKQSARKVGKLI